MTGSLAFLPNRFSRNPPATCRCRGTPLRWAASPARPITCTCCRIPGTRAGRQRAQLAVARNMSVPFAGPDGASGIHNTDARTAANLNDQRCCFELPDSPNGLRAELPALHIEAGRPVRLGGRDDIALSGDVAGGFPVGPAPF